MAQGEDGSTPRKGKLSAFALLTSWLFNKRNTEPAPAETEFLNTRDGYELAKFAKQAFGGDAEAKKAHEAAVEAEQAEIDALLAGTGTVPVAVATPATSPATVATVATAAAAAAPPPAPAVRTPVDVAVRYLEQLRGQGLSVETLAEALIIIESREVRERANKGS
jgi:hypothetical protein